MTRTATSNKYYKFFKSITVTAMAFALIAILDQWLERTLGDRSLFSGYVLLSCCVGLMTLSLRKKLLVLPLGRIAIWQQVHQYLGIFCLAAFAMHIRWPIDGGLELALAILFLLISGSGLVGWYINATTPQKLASTGVATLREEIPALRRAIAEEAFRIALAAAGRTESATLAEHYSRQMSSFFRNRRSLVYCMVPTGVRRRGMLHDLQQISRYLSADGRRSQASLAELVRAKDDLDFQWALQLRLRSWVLFHTAFVWSFFILVAYHVYLVYRYSGA